MGTHSKCVDRGDGEYLVASDCLVVGESEEYDEEDQDEEDEDRDKENSNDEEEEDGYSE